MKKKAGVLLILIAVISTWCLYLLPELRFDYDFEKFFPKDDPDLEFYEKYRKKFTSDNDFILIGIEHEEGIFKYAFLEKVAALTDTLQQLPYVESVISPTTVKKPVIGPFGSIEVPYLHVKQPEKYQSDSLKIYKTKGLVSSLFAVDGKAIAIQLQTEEFINKEESEALLQALDDVLSRFKFDAVHIGGKAKGQIHYVHTLKRELQLFIGSSFLLLVVFLAIGFRSIAGVIIPVIIFILSVIWLLALMVLTNKPVDLISAIVPTILFVVCMSDVVHILSRYLEGYRRGLAKKAALKLALKEVGLATLLTSLTTAIGFLTLATSSVQPVREFGIYTATGVLLAFLLAFSILPAAILLLKRPVVRIYDKRQFWHEPLRKLFFAILRNQKPILAGGAVIVLLAIWGISNIEVNNYLLEDLSEDDPHKQDFIFFEEKFAGVRPFEMAVWVDSSNTIIEPEVLQELDRMEQFIGELYGIRETYSVLTLLKSANQALHGGHQRYYKLPQTSGELKKAKRLLWRIPGRRRGAFDVLSKDRKMARISGKMKDFGGRKIKMLNNRLDSFYTATMDTTLIDYKITGAASLIDKNNEYLAGNMLKGLFIAFIAIALLMGILYRSWMIAVIALIPNVLPLLMIGGVMGASGIDLKVSTSIIFTIIFGIAVDDTIHFMSKFKLELQKNNRFITALKNTYLSTGKAILITTFMLCSGFLTLILSDFNSTYYIGLLISLSFLFALIADLLLLPVLLMIYYRIKKR